MVTILYYTPKLFNISEAQVLHMAQLRIRCKDSTFWRFKKWCVDHNCGSYELGLNTLMNVSDDNEGKSLFSPTGFKGRIL